ncbi:MAG: SPFH domain-containing protein, partial [Methyloprofundus sp.]|nr:SPFH domain-containing protein [Methyloprofundus sp.]
SRFASILGESNIPVLDLAGNYDELSDFISARIAPEFSEYGLEITKLLVENISLPPAVEEALDRRTSMGIIGNLNDYTTFQAADAMKAAAENPSGGASTGIGMGMGFAMANKMSEPHTAPQASQTAAAPPPIPQQTQYFVAVNGQQSGPFNLTELQAKIKAATINRETLIWSQSLVEWTKACEVTELSAYFTAMPPPLPS